MRVDVLTGDVKGQFYPTLSFLQTQANRLISPNQLRHRFRSATVTSDGTFRLASKNQPRLNFKISNGLLMLEDSPIVSSEKFERQFQPVESPNGTRYDLKVARWKDGSEAWLDSRGMLHLRSSDPDIAEITMTLSHGACAGWCSDGTVFGMKFHVGDGPQKPLDEVILLIECFCGHIVNS